MRLFIALLLCLGLTTCMPQVPRVQVLNPAGQDLAGRRSVELIAPQQSLDGEPPLPSTTGDYRSYCATACPPAATTKVGRPIYAGITGWPCRAIRRNSR